MKKLFIVLGIFLIGCGYNNTQIPADAQPLGNDGLSQVDPANLDFATVRAQVFQPHCFQCHSQAGGNRAGVNLESYANVNSRLATIQNAVNSGAMPPSGSLPTATRALLNNWIQAGAPEINSGGPQPNPNPNPQPIPPVPPPCDDRRGDDDDDDDCDDD